MSKIGDVSKQSIETKVVHGAGKAYDSNTGAVSFPIYQTATFRHPGLNQTTGYDYSRLQNPTREQLEKTIANLENAKHGYAFSTGMAAISTMFSFFYPGDHIIVSDDMYGGTYRLFEEVYRRYGIDFTYIDTSCLKNVKENIKENTAAIFIETPSNPIMKITDIKEISDISRARGIISIVDNTFLTPYYQRPIELGADVVIHSGTKYLGGHNDSLAGLIATSNEKVATRLEMVQKSEGAVLSPFDSWLIIRGIKTLAVRMDRQQQNAMVVADWLKNNKNVEKVYYAGLPESAGYEVLKKQASGFGAMISFRVKEFLTVERVLEKVKLLIFAESLGGVESLITYPMVQTHSAIPEEMRKKSGVDDRLLRLSVGIEEVNDIIEDLEQALEC